MFGSGSGFGRTLSTSAWGWGNNWTDFIVNRTNPNYYHFAQGSPEYTCKSGTPCIDGVWAATDPGGRRGACRRTIREYYDHLAADPDWYLLKSTANPGTGPGGACETNPIGYNDVWDEVVPVEHEYVVEKSSPVVYQIGNTIDPSPVYPGGSPPETQGFHVHSNLLLSSVGASMPDVLRYLRQGTTILGAWSQIRLPNLSIYHDHASFSGTFSTATCSWTYTSSSYEQGPLTWSDDIKFAVVAIRSDNDYPVVLLQDAVDVGEIKSGDWCWVDLTNAVKTMWAYWNYSYAGFVIVPYCGDMLYNLGAGSAGADGLARLRPSMTVSASVNSTTGLPISMDYSCDAWRILFDGVSFQNTYVAFELPASTVNTLIDYGDRPALA